jgi:hypothetical protein
MRVITIRSDRNCLSTAVDPVAVAVEDRWPLRGRTLCLGVGVVGTDCAKSNDADTVVGPLELLASDCDPESESETWSESDSDPDAASESESLPALPESDFGVELAVGLALVLELEVASAHSRVASSLVTGTPRPFTNARNSSVSL